jgi:hypothetical protein
LRTRTPLKTEDELKCSGRIHNFHSTSDTHRCTVKRHEHHLTWKLCWTSPVYVNKYKWHKWNVSFTLLSMVRVVHDLKLHVLTCLLSCCDVYYDVRFVFTSICSVGCWCFIYVICIYLRILVKHPLSFVTTLPNIRCHL